MLDITEATKIVNESLPGEKIKVYVEYKNLYLFHMISNRPGEEDMDPFYSVNRDTSEFLDFSIITDGDISEIVSLFVQANKEGR
jgi:hypothetical protein